MPSRLAALAVTIAFLSLSLSPRSSLLAQSKRSDIELLGFPRPQLPVSVSSSQAAGAIQADPVYATMFGGSGRDEMWDHDISGEYMCFVGFTSSPDLRLFRAIQSTLRGDFDGVIGCTDVNTGLPHFITYFGGDSLDVVAAVDIVGDTLYAVGWTRSDSLIGTTGMYQETNGGQSDCFVTKMSARDGGGLRTTFFGGEGIDECPDIVAGPFGAWIVGTTDGMIDLVDPVQDELRGPTDAFFSYLDLDLTDLDFSTLFGSDGRDGGTIIGAAPAPPDTAGGKTDGGRVSDFNIIYGGWTQGDNLPVSKGAYQSSRAGGADIFFGSVFHNTDDESNQWVYGSYYGGPGDDVPEGSVVSKRFVAFGGWTTSDGLNTVGRPFNQGQVDAFIMGTTVPLGRLPMTFGYAGPSEDFNLGLSFDATRLGTVAVGGFASVPEKGHAFTDIYNVHGEWLQTTHTGGSSPADCLTIDLDYGHVSCGGQTGGELFTTPDAFQRSFAGEYDMHGSIHALEVSYSNVFNMTGVDLKGTFNDRDSEYTIPSHTPSPISTIPWNSENPRTYKLAGPDIDPFEINLQPKGADERMISSYVFEDRVETVNPPTIAPGTGELGILAFNYLRRPIEVIRTDQTSEHNIIKQTSVGEGQFFFVPLPYDQNLRISDGTSSVDWTPPSKLYKFELPHVTGYLSDEIPPGKRSGQGLSLVLFTLLGAPVEFPVTTGSEDPEIPNGSGSADRTSGPELRPNYPNPFAGSTRIGYSLSEFSPVTLTVFDVMGRLVQTLVDAHQNAGVYDVQWDGTDAAGAALPSGLYVYRLETESRRFEGSMLLTK